MSFLIKRQLNLIIGVDVTDNCLRIMRTFGNDAASCKVDYISVDPDLIVRGSWDKIISGYLPEYIEKQHFGKTYAVYVVLPDRMIATDVMTVPTLSGKKLGDALQSQINEMYFFYQNYKINKLLLVSNKANTTYELIMVDKRLLGDLYREISALKLYVKNISYSASCALNAVFALRPRMRKQSFLFLDIKTKSACISVCANGCTVGFVRIPFGLNILDDEQVIIEGNLVHNDIANIAVLNMIERAKKSKVFTSSATENDDEDGAKTSDEEADADSKEAVKDGPKKVKVYTRKVKKYPAYMQSSQPETPEAFIVQNFRSFVKRCLLVKMQNEQTDYLPEPGFVLVNMPHEFAFVIDEINKDDNGIEFRYFDPDKEKNGALTSNLDLYGVLFSSGYNKVNNF